MTRYRTELAHTEPMPEPHEIQCRQHVRAGSPLCACTGGCARDKGEVPTHVRRDFIETTPMFPHGTPWVLVLNSPISKGDIYMRNGSDTTLDEARTLLRYGQAKRALYELTPGTVFGALVEIGTEPIAQPQEAA